MEGNKVMEKNCEREEIRTDEMIVHEDSTTDKSEILPIFHNNQRAEEDLNSDGPVIMDGVSKVDIRFKEHTIIAHCSRNLDKPAATIVDIARADTNLTEQSIVAHCSRHLYKPTTIVTGEIMKPDTNLREQINVAESTSDSDEVVIIDDIHLKEQANESQAKSTKNKPDARPYKCDVCDKSYSLLRSLNSHKRCHKKEKPFQCNYCEQQFSTIGNLDKHIVIHSAAQPYKCGVCDKSFTEMNNLSSHLKVHRDGPPHTPLYTL